MRDPASLGAPGHELDGALDGLRTACGGFLAIRRRPLAPELLLHATAGGLHHFAAAVVACERAGLSRAQLLPHVQSTKALFAQSPLVHRLQHWPRGYAGDFETVEWLCDARNRVDGLSLPWAIEQCALQSPLAQQHRNKVSLQAHAILATILANPRSRIASIGCGGCRDFALIQEYVPAGHGEFVLLDADADALALARERLTRLVDRCTFVQGRVPRALTRVRSGGTFDLVVAGGLFDYLPDAWAISTLTLVREMLAPGGRVLFSNIARGNPFRPWIEYLAEWHLIERDESDARRLLAAAGFDPELLLISREGTGLAIIIEARRQRDR